MPDIFGEDIAGQINRELGPLVFDVTLSSVTGGIRSTTNLTSKTSTKTNYVGKGFVDDYEDRYIDGTIIRRGDRKVIILGASLPSGVVPKPTDQTIIEGETKTIVNVTRDPAGATYECQVR
jgi:hypothetical protein